MEIIKIRDLSFGYDSKSKVINNINLSFEESKFYIIAGPNGSGKTTLLRLLSGIYKNYVGYIEFMIGNYHEIKSLKRREISSFLSYIPSGIYTPFNFCVKDIVLMGRRRFKKFFEYYNSTDLDLIYEVSRYVGISNILNKSFNEISTGERQLVLLTQGLVQDTPVMLIDEPTSHLDPRHKLIILNILRELVLKKNKTIIAVMHEIRLATLDFESVVFMKNGRVISKIEYGDIKNRIKDIAYVYDIRAEDVEKVLL